MKRVLALALIVGTGLSFGLADTASAEETSAKSAKTVAEQNAEEAIGGERVARAPAAVGRNGVSRKRYPGGADEDDLQVQETLPIPSRNLDGTAAAASESTTESAPATND